MKPCQEAPDAWFPDTQVDLEIAQSGCKACLAKTDCFAGAKERREPAGVWGGVLFVGGRPGRLPGRPKREAAPAG